MLWTQVAAEKGRSRGALALRLWHVVRLCIVLYNLRPATAQSVAGMHDASCVAWANGGVGLKLNR